MFLIKNHVDIIILSAYPRHVQKVAIRALSHRSSLYTNLDLYLWRIRGSFSLEFHVADILTLIFLMYDRVRLLLLLLLLFLFLP